MRFFRIQPAAYESTRLSLDASRNVPAGETTCTPYATAPKADNGDALIAIRPKPCLLPDIAAHLSAMITAGTCVEIERATYFSFIPAPTLP